jgi:hypothetical protein
MERKEMAGSVVGTKVSLSRARDRVANDNAYANAYEKSDSNDSNNVTHYRLSNTGEFLAH